MDYYGLLFLYYLKGLSGKSVLRLFFNIEAGGTEQLLPENTSTPTTTPILADIQYPDGLRTDQYFTYRETPTTVSNKARIKTIKGNTLAWNQLANASSGSSIVRDVTLSVDSSGTITASNQTASSTGYGAISSVQLTADGEANHVYLLGAMLVSGTYSGNMFWFGESSTMFTVGSPSIVKPTNIGNKQLYFQFTENETYNFVIKPYVFDLTKMFGAGKEPTTVEEFTSLFPLPYYDYNAGTLLSFNGNGIQTVGKNLFDANAIVDSSGHTTYVYVQDGYLRFLTGNPDATGIHWDNLNLPCPLYFKGSVKNFASTSNVVRIIFDLSDGTTDSISFSSALSANEEVSFSKVIGASGKKIVHMRNAWTDGKGAGINLSVTQLEFGTTETSYEPYTSSTLSLPISTYFPNGMKSAGTVYDELTPTKAITRIGAVDLGSLTWTYETDVSWGKSFRARADYIKFQGQLLCTRYQGYVGALNNMPDMNISATNSQAYLFLRVKDSNYTDATAFGTAMSGVYLFYELATPIETPITTEDANEALSLLMGKSVSSSNAKQMIDIITKGE